MADLRSYPKEFISEFINLYKSYPCLWNINAKEYKDRYKKNNAFEKLIEKFKEVDPEADRDLVATKLGSLRNCYRKERNKVRRSKQLRVKPNEIYVPTLWYYDLFNFVYEDDKPTDKMVNESIDKTNCSRINETAVSKIDNYPLKLDKNDINCISSNDYQFEPFSPPQMTDDPLCTINHDTFVNVDLPAASSHSLTCQTKKLKFDNNIDGRVAGDTKLNEDHRRTDDVYDSFGRYIAHKLRSLPKDQQINLKKLINDGIYEAELGNLKRNCSILIPPNQ